MKKMKKFMSVLSGSYAYIFGLIFALIAFWFGMSRINFGIRFIRTVSSDYELAHFMNVGVLYISLSVLFIIYFVFVITIIICNNIHKRK